MEIRIRTQLAKLGLNISKPRMNMQITKPTLEMRTTKPQLQMRQGSVSLSINQDRCFEDMNRRKIISFIFYSRDVAKAVTDQAITQIAQEGDQMQAIERGITIADIAKQKFSRMKEFDFGMIPRQRPEISAHRTPLEMTYQPGSIELNLIRGNVRVNLQYGEVRGYYLQRPSVEITVVPSRFDRRG